MNYHLMIDHWFINGFIAIAESVSPGKNTFIFTFPSPGKYVKTTAGTYAPFDSPELDALIAGINPRDRFFIHWFHAPVIDVIRRLHKDVPVYLCFWGGELISQTKNLYRFNYDDLTRKYLENAKESQGLSEIDSVMNFPKWVRDRVKRWLIARREMGITVGSRRELMNRVDFFCHWNELDLDVVKKEYGGSPTFLNFFYEGSLEKITFQENAVKSPGTNRVVWLGNSDTDTNNHLDAIESLKTFAAMPMQVVCPLSYGFKDYGDMVDEEGKRAFGPKWKSLREFMPLDEYLQLQMDVDVVVMYHNRTQAGFNIFGFLKMGKKIYLKPQSTIYHFLKKHGILVFDATLIDKQNFEQFCEPLTDRQRRSNSELISALFSEERKIESYKKMLIEN